MKEKEPSWMDTFKVEYEKEKYREKKRDIDDEKVEETLKSINSNLPVIFEECFRCCRNHVLFKGYDFSRRTYLENGKKVEVFSMFVKRNDVSVSMVLVNEEIKRFISVYINGFGVPNMNTVFSFIKDFFNEDFIRSYFVVLEEKKEQEEKEAEKISKKTKANLNRFFKGT